MEKGIHRKILGIRILWLCSLSDSFILTLIVAILVNEKAMMGSLILGFGSYSLFWITCGILL